MHPPRIAVLAPGTHIDASSLQLNGYFSHPRQSQIIFLRPKKGQPSKMNTLRSLVYLCGKGLRCKADAYVVVGAMVASTLAGQIVAALRKKPLIVEWDDMVVQDFNTSVPKWYQLAYWEYRGIRKAQGVMCVSRGLVDTAKKFGHSDEDTILIPMGVDVDRFDPKKYESAAVRKSLGIPADAKVIGYIGNIPAIGADNFMGKGVIEIFEEYKKLEPRAFLVFVGGGTGLSLVEKAIQERGLQNCTLIAGPQDQERLPQYISAFDIGCDVIIADWKDRVNLRYRSSIKMKEYMAMEKPVLAHPVGENVDYLDGGRLGIFAHTDWKDTAALIKGLLDDKDRLKTLKVELRKKAVEEYSFGKLGREFEDFILKVIREGLSYKGD